MDTHLRTCVCARAQMTGRKGQQSEVQDVNKSVLGSQGLSAHGAGHPKHEGALVVAAAAEVVPTRRLPHSVPMPPAQSMHDMPK